MNEWYLSTIGNTLFFLVCGHIMRLSASENHSWLKKIHILPFFFKRILDSRFLKIGHPLPGLQKDCKEQSELYKTTIQKKKKCCARSSFVLRLSLQKYWSEARHAGNWCPNLNTILLACVHAIRWGESQDRNSTIRWFIKHAALHNAGQPRTSSHARDATSCWKCSSLLTLSFI